MSSHKLWLGFNLITSFVMKKFGGFNVIDYFIICWLPINITWSKHNKDHSDSGRVTGLM